MPPNNFVKILRRQPEYFAIPNAIPTYLSSIVETKAIIALPDNTFCCAFYAQAQYGGAYKLYTYTCKFDPIKHTLIERTFVTYEDITTTSMTFGNGISGVYRNGYLILTVGVCGSNYYTGRAYTILLKVEGTKLARLDTDTDGTSETYTGNYYCQLFESGGNLYQVFNHEGTHIRIVDIVNEKLVFSKEQLFGKSFPGNSSYVYNYLVIPLSGGRILLCFGERTAKLYAGKINADGTVTWGNEYNLPGGSGYVWAAEVDATHVAVVYAYGSDYNSSRIAIVKVDGITISKDTAEEVLTSGTSGGRDCYVFVSNGYINAISSAWKVYTYDVPSKKLSLVQTLSAPRKGRIFSPQDFLIYTDTNFLVTATGYADLIFSITSDCSSLGEDTATGVTVTRSESDKPGTVLSYSPVSSLNAVYGIREEIVGSIKNEAIGEIQKEVKNNADTETTGTGEPA